jgi:hypothetical protein
MNAVLKADELLLTNKLIQVSHGAVIVSRAWFCRGSLSEYWLGAADYRSPYFSSSTRFPGVC